MRDENVTVRIQLEGPRLSGLGFVKTIDPDLDLDDQLDELQDFLRRLVLAASGPTDQ